MAHREIPPDRTVWRKFRSDDFLFTLWKNRMWAQESWQQVLSIADLLNSSNTIPSFFFSISVYTSYRPHRGKERCSSPVAQTVMLPQFWRQVYIAPFVGVGYLARGFSRSFTLSPITAFRLLPLQSFLLFLFEWNKMLITLMKSKLLSSQ